MEARAAKEDLAESAHEEVMGVPQLREVTA
jgi:hypothetical protein